MSAYVVCKAHIDALITAGLMLPNHGPLRWFHPDYQPGWSHEEYERAKHELRWDNADEVGQMLVDECVRSVSYRYPQDDPQKGELPGPIDAYYLHPYTFARWNRHLEAVVVLKAVACYRYQSCEHPEWESSEAYQFCEALEQAAIWALPGMSEAAGWDLTEEDRNPASVIRLRQNP
jgi:hypothetical protein